ncbi:uncharacterized protein PgNI_00361 [Pyricularia grisea]|uniref:Transcription initiation factor TFIID subunit 2 n=1 Tax=Pyricularia grisea TaxID=148305 RepID=A0A6P8BFJ6_PYRGI|nr:uncharacterized protein PgNI_00361 [Pyricularia grisea]TLD15568.1 hypothetical protein PgNI_00361 [Pyricularia grisea]
MEDASNSGGEPDLYAWVVMSQEVEVEVNFVEKQLTGFATLSIVPLNGDNHKFETVRIDARQMDIDTDKITVNGNKVKAVYHDPYDELDIPDGFNWDGQQFHYQQKRIGQILNRTTPEVPVSVQSKSGHSPSYGSLEVSLRPEEIMVKKAGFKIRLKNNDFESSKVLQYDIVVPFRSRPFRDGFQFVGVEETDTRYPHFYTRNSEGLGMASCIFPCIDDPGARSYWTLKVKIPRTLGDALKQPLLTQRSTAKNGADADESRFALTEEDKLLDMTVIASGILVGEHSDKDDDSKKTMEFQITGKEMSAQHVGFAVGPFQHVDLWSEFRTEADDDKLGKLAIKVHGYCLPRREDEVRFTCEPMSMAADFFATKFGQYPFDSYKMCFVDDMITDTMPLCSFSLCSSRLLYPQDIIDNESEVTRELVHALASQYFGINIIPDTISDLWVTIGISHYITDLFMQQLCGNNHYRFQMKTRADRLVEEDVNRLPLDQLGYYLGLGDYQSEFMALKAPLVLFILDKRMTKKASHNGVRRVVLRLVSRSNTEASDVRFISSESFRKQCEKVHKGAPLELFWQQWIQSAGCARFDMSQRYNKKHSRVDLTVRQPEEKSQLPQSPLNKNNFWGVLQDGRHVPAVKKENVSVWFTGPITIGIHEANGTPYEHVAEIQRTGPRQFKAIEMPYNTKYKRLKRTRRQKERAQALAQAGEGGEQAEEAVLYSLGDVLQSPEEEKEWGLADWTPEQVKAMEQDSFEWLRIDADFEWICSMKTNMQPWMYVSQLQQDRDVVAQQESVLWLSQKAGGEILATVLGRTLMDTRYYHGIRTQAIKALQKQVWTKEEESLDPDSGIVNKLKKTDAGGLRILMKAFKAFFCYPDSQTPRPNDFSNKMQYAVQRAIPEAIARVREKGRCPREAQQFLLEQLQFNNNTGNEYSDHFYVAGLLDALATSLIPDNSVETVTLRNSDDPEVALDDEFLEAALQMIERYLRMDEWTNSYQNIWTVTALGCKQKLMKAGVIPISAIDFVRYLQDSTLDLISIKAFEALVDLGFLFNKKILRLLLAYMTTHYSPFMRDRLFKVFAWGVAGLAFGEYDELKSKAEQQAKLKEDEEAEDEFEGDSLMLVNADAILERKKAKEARRTTVGAAVAELRKEFGKSERQDLMIEIWRAATSPIIGLKEQRSLLDMCETLFEADYSCRVTVRHPTKWHCERGPTEPKKLIIHFKAVQREITKRPEPKPEEPPVKPVVVPAVVPAVTPAAAPPPPTPTPTVASSHTPMEGVVATPTMPAPPQRQGSTKIKFNVNKGVDKSRQNSTTPVPKVSTTLPKVSTTVPKVSTTVPKASTTVPKASTTVPKASTTVPKVSTTVPKVSTTASKISATASAVAESPSSKVLGGSISASPSTMQPTATPTTQRTALPSGTISGNGVLAKKPSKPISTPVNGSIKRKLDDASGPPSKSPRPTKIVRVRLPQYINKLRPDTRQQILRENALKATSSRQHSSASDGSITAKPARKPLPSGSAPSSSTPQQQKVRKPLPNKSSPATTSASEKKEAPPALPPLDPVRAVQAQASSAASPSPSSGTKLKIKFKVKPTQPPPQ